MIQGSAHSSWANGNEHLKDVVEVIDTARDQKHEGKMEKKAGVVDEDISSDSSSSSEDEDDGIPDGSAGDKQGPVDRFRDYNKRKKGLHRQHRGVMQWKVSCHVYVLETCMLTAFRSPEQPSG